MASLVAKLRDLWRYSLLGRSARSAMKLMPRGTVLPILKGPLRGKKWVVRSSFQSCWFGVYEYEKQEQFRQTIKPGDVVYDVGANVGFYTLLASVLVGPPGKVISFEPLPRNLALLRRHIQLNRLRNVEVYAGAVSGKPGTARFDAEGLPEMGHLSDRGQFEVEVFQLDELVASGRIPPPQVMKIDVEGAELDVLEGASRLLREHRPVILLATHGEEVHRGCLELLGEQYVLSAMDDKPLDQSSEVRAQPRDGVH
jgi:FkbM family methyltransferase